jgi:hypothetical protein
MPRYSEEPVDRAAYRRRFDRFYARTARVYDLAVRFVPASGVRKLVMAVLDS